MPFSQKNLEKFNYWINLGFKFTFWFAIGAYIAIMMTLCSSCTDRYHARRIQHHLHKMGKGDIIKDSTARDVIIPGSKLNVTLEGPQIKQGSTFQEGKLRIKYTPTYIHDTLAAIDLEGECLPDTVTVYDTKEVEIHTLPPTYKEFFKQLTGVNNLQFWLIHTVAGLLALLVVFFKVIKPLI